MKLLDVVPLAPLLMVSRNVCVASQTRETCESSRMLSTGLPDARLRTAPVSILNLLPAEVIDVIIQKTDDFATLCNFLTASGIRAHNRTIALLLQRAIKPLGQIQLRLGDKRTRVEKDIFCPVRAYLRDAAGLPLGPNQRLSLTVESIASAIPTIVKECIDMASLVGQNAPVWSLNCMAAFVESGYLPMLWVHLDSFFQYDFITKAISAAARHSELPTLEFLLRAAGFLRHYDELGPLMESICASGDKQVYQVFEKLAPEALMALTGDIIVQYGNMELLKYVEARDKGLYTHGADHYLELAASYGHQQMFEYLLGKGNGASVTSAVLGAAAKYGHLNILQLVLRGPENLLSYQDYFYRFMLTKAVESDQMAVVKFLLTCGADDELLWPSIDPATINQQALWQAMRFGRVTILKLLLGRRPNGRPIFPKINMGAAENCLFNTAIVHNQLEMVQFISDTFMQGTDPRFGTVDFANNDNRPLKWAVERRYFEIFKLLLDMAASGHPNCAAIRPCLVQEPACALDDVRFVKELFRHQTDGTGFRFLDLDVDNCYQVARRHNRRPICEFLESLQFIGPDE